MCVATQPSRSCTARPTPDHLNISHANVNSLTTKNRLDELEQFANSYDIHIMCITETKLDSTVNQSLYKMDSFGLPHVKHRSRHGGGVAIYARSNIAVTRIPELETDNVESLWVKVRIKQTTLILCCTYLPPNLNSSDHQNFLDKLTDNVVHAQVYAPSSVIILGDFNVGNIFLSPEHANNHSGITSFDTKLYDAIAGVNLTQLIHEPTRISDTTANLRDLILVQKPELIVDSGLLSPFSQIDHVPIFVSVRCPMVLDKPFVKTLWNYREMNIDAFVNFLTNVDWDEIMNNDVNIAAESLTKLILDAAHQCIPQRTINKNSREKPWVTKELKEEIGKRNKLFKKAKHTNRDEDWKNWRSQRNMATDLNRRLKAQHIRHQVSKLTEYKQDPRKYHQILKNMLGRSKIDRIPPLTGTNGQTLENDLEKANLLNDYPRSPGAARLPINHTLNQ